MTRVKQGQDFSVEVGPLTVVHQLRRELCFYLLTDARKPGAQAIAQALVAHMADVLGEGRAGQILAEQFSGQSRDPRLKRAIKTLEENFTDEISIPVLAQRSGMSVRTLNRLFVDELSATPKQVQAQFRVRHAQKLLRKRGRLVTEVAFEVGYSSLSQFIDAYRRITGRLPSQERHA